MLVKLRVKVERENWCSRLEIEKVGNGGEFKDGVRDG